VGIGASAGGFEATCVLLQAIPRGANLALVVIQHLDPHHKSLAAELLARHTRLSVQVAATGMRVEADHVYTVPADHEVTASGGMLKLVPLSSALGLRLPIDRFFASLAAEYQARAVGVILSGTGADGSVGIKTIVAHGGIALVQQPDTAQFDGMPLSAIATGVVSQVLPVVQLAQTLVAYAAHPYVRGVVEDGADGDDALSSVLETMHERRPQNFIGYKQSTLLRRIERRMGLKSIGTLADYARMIRSDDTELDALAADMLIGVTDFFRDPQAWEVLTREVIDPLVRSREDPTEVIRAWVPGTSTGEEAYTLAMLLIEALQRQGKACAVQVFATDANGRALAVARAGRYPIGIAPQMSPERLKRFFAMSDDLRHYQVSPQLRASVVFGPQNLFGDPPFSRVDLVSCRNVLIYMDAEAQRRVIALFHFALRPGGCLMLGTAEHLGGSSEQFECLSKLWQIYRRVGNKTAGPLGFALSPVKRSTQPLGAGSVGPARRTALLKGIAQRLILDQFAPPSALVDGHYQALYFSGPIERFLGRLKGTPTSDVLAMAGELRSRLRAALRAAAKRGTPVVYRAARTRRARDSRAAIVEMTVTPIAASLEHGALYLIVFVDVPTAAARGRVSKGTASVQHLEDDLRTTRADLQRAVEELESAHSDIDLSREDKNTANEELQSINEELESSKEELQSLNEELQTVNQQLRSKVSELETANDDINNLLRSSDIVTLCLDCEMCIRWHSPATQRLVNILPGDIGRPIGDFASDLLGQSLIDMSRSVIATLAPQQSEIETGQHRWFLRRVMPYRVKESEVNGVIVSFADITDTKRATAQALAERETLLGSLEERVMIRTAQLRSMAFALSVAEEGERRVVAADLHDDLGQTLALIRVKLDMLVKHSSGGPLEAGLREITALVEAADERVRSLVFQLSPPVLSELGLPAALAWLADEMQRIYGLKVELSDPQRPQLTDPVARTIVFRAARELLINVARHAKVTATRVDVQEIDGEVRITVADSGGGFDVNETLARAAAAGHFGLVSVRERLEFVGGKLEIRSIPNAGTEATIAMPNEPLKS
jgi:two-component system CheB/CheR fusion protein